MPGAADLERVPFTGLLVRFAGELRSAGLAPGSGDVLTYCAAVASLDPTDLLDLYWGGRATLVTRRDRPSTGRAGRSGPAGPWPRSR